MRGDVEKRRVLLLCSYCGTDDATCSDSLTCADCLEMCNVIDVECVILTNHGGLDYRREVGFLLAPTEVQPDPSRARHEDTERSRE